MPSNGTNLLRAKPNRAEKKEHTPLPLFRAEHRKEETSPGELKAFGFDYYCAETGYLEAETGVFVLKLVRGGGGGGGKIESIEFSFFKKTF